MDEAYVETKEQWRLLWYDAITNNDVRIFDTLNQHIYLLKKEDQFWKIYMDEYRGTPKKAF